jgi:hypothetical protein
MLDVDEVVDVDSVVADEKEVSQAQNGRAVVRDIARTARTTIAVIIGSVNRNNISPVSIERKRVCVRFSADMRLELEYQACVDPVTYFNVVITICKEL